MIQPIPKKVLIHKAKYTEYSGEGRYGKEYKDPIILENVLVQPVSSVASNSIGDSISYSSLMFFDCVNSSPRNIKFTKESKIEFNGEEMMIDKVNPIYTFNLHHYELELV